MRFCVVMGAPGVSHVCLAVKTMALQGFLWCVSRGTLARKYPKTPAKVCLAFFATPYPPNVDVLKLLLIQTARSPRHFPFGRESAKRQSQNFRVHACTDVMRICAVTRWVVQIPLPCNRHEALQLPTYSSLSMYLE